MGDLIDSTDATVWADEVMKVDWAVPFEDDAREVLVGWFANAIAAGQNEAARKFREENPDLVGRCEACGKTRPGALDEVGGGHVCWRCLAEMHAGAYEAAQKEREELLRSIVPLSLSSKLAASARERDDLTASNDDVRQILADERARASRADAELRSALESALLELKRNAATWITLEPILSAHVYEYAPRGDGHVWTAYKRFARPEQALAVAEKARAALAGVSRGE